MLPRGGTGGGTFPDGTRFGLGGEAAVVLKLLPLSTAGYCWLFEEDLVVVVAVDLASVDLLCRGGGLTGPAGTLTGVDVAIGIEEDNTFPDPPDGVVAGSATAIIHRHHTQIMMFDFTDVYENEWSGNIKHEIDITVYSDVNF